jgi:hypothetical protein
MWRGGNVGVRYVRQIPQRLLEPSRLSTAGMQRPALLFSVHALSSDGLSRMCLISDDAQVFGDLQMSW